jgi:hypothetical protein
VARTCSLDGGVVRTWDDYAIVVDRDASALAAVTVVIATQESRGRLCDDGVADAPLAGALARIPETTRILSICTGSYRRTFRTAGADRLAASRPSCSSSQAARSSSTSVRSGSRSLNSSW